MCGSPMFSLTFLRSAQVELNYCNGERGERHVYNITIYYDPLQLGTLHTTAIIHSPRIT